MDVSRFSSLHVSTELDGRLVVVELDHGRANEMGSAQIAEWAALADALEASDARAMVTFSRKRSSRGTAIFVSGADVTERVGWPDNKVRAHVRWQRETLQRLRRAPVFHVCVVDGVAFGWGTEFLLACDYRIAGPRARFALPETGLGILPGAGGTGELWSVVGVNQALRLGMTGERIDGAEAHRIGLVDETAPDLDAGLQRARELAGLATRRSPTAIAAYKRAVLAAVGLPGPERAELEARAYEHCVESGDATLGRMNFKRILAGEQIEWSPRRPFRLP